MTISNVTNFPGGVSTGALNSAMTHYGLPDPCSWHTWFDDFDEYHVNHWILTTVELGAGSATEVTADEDGGVLVVTNAAGDNDHDFFQWSGTSNGAVSETFKFEAGKKLLFKSRFKVSDATQSDLVMGLQITDTTPLDVTDGVFFKKDDGDALLDLRVEKDNTGNQTNGLHTVVDDTYLEVAFFYNGSDKVEGYVNGSLQTTLATTNLPDDEELTISFGIQNGEAAAKSMSIDYIFVAKER
jgi:hypothetical protein